MYIELHCHSAFSFLDGASLPEQLALTASQLGYPALALTDHHGLYGSMAFAQEAKQLGLQAITGAELTLLDGSHVTLLAETPEGYANLCRLITEAHLGREDRRDPRLEFASLEARHAGLIVLSGCRSALVPGLLRRDGLAAARRFAERCRSVFGKENFVVELQRNYVRGDLALPRALKDVADSARLGVVASGNVHYHRRERHRLHDVMVAIRHRTTLDGSHDVRHANSEFFLRPPEKVEALFRDCPDAVANALVLAERCREFDLTRDLGYRFPDFHGAERAPAPRALAELCRARLEERYPVDSLHRGEAERRLADELRVHKRYGHEHVGLVCSFPTYRLRSTVREIGKVLDLPPGEIEQVAKLADRRSGGLADELDQLPGFAGRRSAPLWKELCELAEEIAGLPRHISQHVGGMVISSRAQIQMIRRTRPTNLEDLAVEVAIVRPGPIVGGAVNPYVRRREDQRRARAAGRPYEPPLEHPLLKEALAETLGVILYQDQVLQVCQALAGFTAGQAEALRRAMSRRRSRELMAGFWEEFRDGAAARAVPEQTAERVFTQVIAFSEFGFPKSHAAAFGLLAYQSAWLRHYHPAEYYCALFNNQPMGFYSLDVLGRDAERNGVEIRLPDVNASDVWCMIERDAGCGMRDAGAVRVGLGFVRDWSEETATAVVIERERRGPYVSIGDFVRRAPPKLKRTAIEHLVWVGGCDGFGLTRRELLWQVGLWLPPEAEHGVDARGRRQLELALNHPHEGLRFGGLEAAE